MQWNVNRSARKNDNRPSVITRFTVGNFSSGATTVGAYNTSFKTKKAKADLRSKTYMYSRRPIMERMSREKGCLKQLKLNGSIKLNSRADQVEENF